MILKIFNLIQRAVKKPLPVLLFRFKQSLQLQWLYYSSGWEKIAVKCEHLSNCEPCPDTVILNKEIPFLNEIQKNTLRETAQNVLKSKFDIFGSAVPNLSNCNFSVDWRFGHHWTPKYFKHYSFYEKKNIPYDVKFPWELSRFYYLVPVMAWEMINGANKSTLTWVFDLLSRWRKENPLAESVNWYPMEASMRMINLIFILDFVLLLFERKENEVKKELMKLHKILLIMIREHGEFVWINREFTDVRGNHFTANLVALLYGFLALNKYSGTPYKWYQYVETWLEKEIFLQFLPDGVNFEKSCSYHKLVTELFVLAGIALEKYGAPLTKKAHNRLKKAAFFSQSITRPDGLAANFGDNDDAVALPFVFESPRNHGSIVELTRSWLKTPIGTTIYNDADALAALFIIGRVESVREETSNVEVFEFPEGGYTVVRNKSNDFFFMVDVGEVGMNGRGGHGHNDLLSFELCIDGLNVVIDPGCSVYTADLIKKQQYRSTSEHSTIQLYDEEIARVTGHWTIENDALPKGVTVTRNKYGAVISAEHNGYCRIEAGSYISRRFTIDAHMQSVIIDDEITVPCDGVKACWHYPVGHCDNLSVANNYIAFGNADINIEMVGDLPFTELKATFSTGYGIENDGSVIYSESSLARNKNHFRFCIRKSLENV